MSKVNTMDLVSNLNLEAERKFAAQSNRAARVKIEKGHAWLIRLLPFPQGPTKQPFARIAQHWVGGRAFCCKRHTSPDFGGDPDAICHVCDVADQMHSEATEQSDKDAFYGVQVRISYRAYCLVFSKEDERGRREDMTPEEILTAHEFNIPKTGFSVIAAKLDRSKGRKGGSPLGLLDLEMGTDLWVARDVKNSLSFDLSEQGPGPIFDMDDQFDTKLQRVWKQLKQPTVTFLSDERLNAMADMIAEKAFERAAKSLEGGNQNNSRNGGGSSRGGNSRGAAPRGTFHEGEAEEPPARGRARSNGFARAQAALEEAPAQEQSGEEDQVPGAEVPAQEQEQAPPARTSPRRAPVATAETAETGEPGTGQEAAQEQEQAPPVTARRTAGAAVRQATPMTRVSVPPSVAQRRTGPAAPPAGRAAGGRIEDETPAEDPPEEQRDPAPPQDQAAEQQDQAAEQQEQAPVSRPARNPALAGALRQSVATMSQRGR